MRFDNVTIRQFENLQSLTEPSRRDKIQVEIDLFIHLNPVWDDI